MSSRQRNADLKFLQGELDLLRARLFLTGFLAFFVVSFGYRVLVHRDRISLPMNDPMTWVLYGFLGLFAFGAIGAYRLLDFFYTAPDVEPERPTWIPMKPPETPGEPGGYIIRIDPTISLKFSPRKHPVGPIERSPQHPFCY